MNFCVTPSRLSFRYDGEIKCFPDKQKLKRIHHHQTSFTTNAKGTSLGRKHKRRKRPIQNKSKTIKRMVIGSGILTITLTVNGLSASPKNIDWLDKGEHVNVRTST